MLQFARGAHGHGTQRVAGEVVHVPQNWVLLSAPKCWLQMVLLCDSETMEMSKKIRLDLLLVQRGLFPSREQAQASIMAGLIKVGGQLSDKAGAPVAPEAVVEIVGKPHPYV